MGVCVAFYTAMAADTLFIHHSNRKLSKDHNSQQANEIFEFEHQNVLWTVVTLIL